MIAIVLTFLLSIAGAGLPAAGIDGKCSLMWQENAPAETTCVYAACLGVCYEVTIEAPATLELPEGSYITYCACEGSGGSNPNECVGYRITTYDDEGNLIADSNQCRDINCSSNCETIEIEYEGVTWI